MHKASFRKPQGSEVNVSISFVSFARVYSQTNILPEHFQLLDEFSCGLADLLDASRHTLRFVAHIWATKFLCMDDILEEASRVFINTYTSPLAHMEQLSPVQRPQPHCVPSALCRLMALKFEPVGFTTRFEIIIKMRPVMKSLGNNATLRV